MREHIKDLHLCHCWAGYPGDERKTGLAELVTKKCIILPQSDQIEMLLRKLFNTKV